MHKDYRKELIELAGEYGKALGLTEKTVSRYATNDTAFIQKMRDGKTCTVDKYIEVREFFKKGIREAKQKQEAAETRRG